MGKDINIFKEQNEIWIIIKTIIVSILLGLTITFGVSVVCGFRWDFVVSYSMYPTYTRGTLVMIEPTPYEDLKIGDVVNYDFASITCSHRLVGFDENGDMLTQGDAEDSPKIIDRSKYRGRITFHTNIFGQILWNIRNNVILFGFCAMIFLFIYVIV